jgi:hypothetical protein
MAAEFHLVFAALKQTMQSVPGPFRVLADTSASYNLAATIPSPYKQHKGQPMWFGAVRLGKAYVSYHLMPLYMSADLTSKISPGLKKRMQGKTCFNFKTMPDPVVLEELRTLTADAVSDWKSKGWL